VVITVKVFTLPPKEWVLDVGPVEDDEGNLLVGANVTLTIGEEVLTNTTNADGIAHFDLLDTHVGLDLNVAIEIEGFESVAFDTSIGLDRKLREGPPSLLPELVPTIARPGEDISTDVGERVEFDGSTSEGNGDIVNFTWSFEHDGETVKLYGPKPYFVFELPGVYLVTLNVTDIRDMTAEGTLNVTIRTVPVPPWRYILTIGPVTDELFQRLADATVTLTIGMEEYTNTTDEEGLAQFELWNNTLDRDVSVTVELEGYEPAEYDTKINIDMILAQNPPSLVKKETPKPPPDDGDEFPTTTVAGISIAVVIILIIIFFLLGRASSFVGRRKDEGEGLDEVDLEPVRMEGEEELIVETDEEPEMDDDELEDQDLEGEEPEEDPLDPPGRILDE
jgi:hypothetical protein